MKILVTGCLGTIGRPLCKAIQAAGHQVAGLDLYDAPEPHVFPYIRCDIGEHREVLRAFDVLSVPDFVYNLAAEPGRISGSTFYEKLWRSNVIGLRNLIEAQRTLRFRLIHFSTSEIYGSIDGEMDEGLFDQVALRPNGDYGLSKLVGEQMLRNAARDGQEVLAIRPFGIYGPGERPSKYRSAVVRFCWAALKRDPVEVCEGSRCWLYVDDFVRTAARIPDRWNTRPTAVNIGSREIVQNVHLAKLAYRAADVDERLIRTIPAEIGNAPTKLPSTALVAKWLGHEDRVLIDEGVMRTVEWLRTQTAQT